MSGSPFVKKLLDDIEGNPIPNSLLYGKYDREKLQRVKVDWDPSGFGKPERFGRYVLDTQAAFRRIFGGRHPEVLDCEEIALKAHHNCKPDKPESKDSCTGCSLEKRAEEGRPAMKYFTRISIDAEPQRLVEQPMKAKKHKRKRWMRDSYHNRIQKKWDKKVLGNTELCVAREEFVWVFGKMQFVNFSCMLREGRFHRPASRY